MCIELVRQREHGKTSIADDLWDIEPLWIFLSGILIVDKRASGFLLSLVDWELNRMFRLQLW